CRGAQPRYQVRLRGFAGGGWGAVGRRRDASHRYEPRGARKSFSRKIREVDEETKDDRGSRIEDRESLCANGAILDPRSSILYSLRNPYCLNLGWTFTGS